MAKTITTPKGKAIYPKLQPGKPDTKFKPEGEYKVTVELPIEESQVLMKAIETVRDKEHETLAAQLPPAKAKKLKKADLPFEETEEGTVHFKFKMKAKVTTKQGTTFTQRPAIFDAKGKPMITKAADGLEECVTVGGGSMIKVAFEPIPYETALLGVGVTLRLKAVQVIELSTFGDQSAGGYGFGEEEGFDADEYEAPANEDESFEEEEDFDKEGEDDNEPEEGDF